MPVPRIFLSYAAADRELVEQVAVSLTVRGFLPIYDQWWLRSSRTDDAQSSRLELQMGLRQADAFVYFNSEAAQESHYVQYECDWAMSLTCSDPPDLVMICVILNGLAAHVPHWFKATIYFSSPSTSDQLTDRILKTLRLRRFARCKLGVRSCRKLARASDFMRLRAKLFSADQHVRSEAAILLAFLDNNLDSRSVQAIVHELASALPTYQAERAIVALGRLKTDAATAVHDIARFAESDADPQLRALAVRVLGRLGARNETISALAGLAIRGAGVRTAALTELGNMGAAAAGAVATVVELSHANDHHSRLVALAALGNIGDCRREVLVVVLKALAETESRGMSPSQLHYTAMCVLNQLNPSDSDLAGALLPAREYSRRFSEWFSEQFPEYDTELRSDLAPERLNDVLLMSARQILNGCRLIAGRRPL